MPGDVRRTDDLLRAMSDGLGLGYEPQDWGIVNADGDRLDEFIAFFQGQELTGTQKFELAALILASCNERLQDGNEVDDFGLMGLIRAHTEHFSAHITYWCELADAEQFPLGVWLRTLELC